MSKICDWYKQDICDCFCDGLDANCKNYSGNLYVDADTKKVDISENDWLKDLSMEQKEQM